MTVVALRKQERKLVGELFSFCAIPNEQEYKSAIQTQKKKVTSKHGKIGDKCASTCDTHKGILWGRLIRCFTILVVWNYFPNQEGSFMWCHQDAQLPLRNNGKEKGLSPLELGVKSFPHRTHMCLFFLSGTVQSDQDRDSTAADEVWPMCANSPLVDKSELAIYRAARDELSGLDVDVFGRLVGPVGQGAAHRHQAGQVWGFLLPVAFALQLAAGPTLHVSSAVESAVSVHVCGQTGRVRNIKREIIWKSWDCCLKKNPEIA